MRIAICTDAWHPQVNGVVRTLAATVDRLIALGHEVELVTPSQFLTMPLPGYNEIRLAMLPRFGTRRTLSDFAPEVVHIATEGPIGWSARSWCKANGVPFTTAFHTRFPEYAAVRTGLSVNRFWPLMRRFHGPSRAVLVSTPSLAAELAQQGIGQTRLWTRGIDRDLFVPGREPLPELANLPRPIMLNVGRIRSRRTLSHSLKPRCREPRSSSAAVRIWRGCRHAFPMRSSLARGTARNSRVPIARRTSSCSRAGPTHSGW